MYNNKQDFVPPLVDYGIVYVTNMESFLYFLNKAYGQLGYHSARTKGSCQQTILYDAFPQ